MEKGIYTWCSMHQFMQPNDDFGAWSMKFETGIKYLMLNIILIQNIYLNLFQLI